VVSLTTNNQKLKTPKPAIFTSSPHKYRILDISSGKFEERLGRQSSGSGISDSSYLTS